MTSGAIQRRSFRRHFVTWPRILVFGVVLTGWFASSLLAELGSPTAEDRQIARMVAHLIRSEHLSRRELDDEISQRCLESFLGSLDPSKSYFLASDIAEFNRRKNDIDDMVRKGDVHLAHEIFDRFLRRVDTRLSWVNELIDTNFDYTRDEEIIRDPDDTTYAADEAEARDRWRKKIKYELLVKKVEDVDAAEAKERIQRRYRSFAKRMHQIDNEELLEIFLTSLTTGYDPHTVYMSPSRLKSFDIEMSLELEGIGAELRYEDGMTVISKIIPGGAAEKDSRLKPGDKILGVAQGDADMVDVVEMKLTDVVKLIRGKPDSVVRLQVEPAGSSDIKIYDIVRAKIKLKDKEAQSDIFEVEGPSGKFQVGVIDLPAFYMDMEGARNRVPNYKSTTRDVRRILEKFNREGVDAVVMDLRRNGGGSLIESIQCTGLFIDQGPVVQVRDSDGEVSSYRDEEEGMVWKGPLVVLTSKFSASASEIFAGAIQDYERGIIIGDYATHGKGTVQSVLDLGSRMFFRLPRYAQAMGALKLTTQQFYRPSGESTQMRGVRADIELPSLSTHLPISESDQDHAFEWNRIKSAYFPKLNFVNPQVLKGLRELSQRRIAESEDFQNDLETIQRYNELKNKKTVTLNEERFREERKRFDAEDEEEKQIEKVEDTDSIRRDYYLNEALAITADYVAMSRHGQVAQVHQAEPRHKN